MAIGVSPWTAGLTGRCPRCGEGPLFAGFLRLAHRCDACGLELSDLNAADGPAFFAMSIVSILVGFAALVVEVAYSPPVWVHMLIWLPVLAGLCLALLRPIKGVVVALTYRHRGFETREEGG